MIGSIVHIDAEYDVVEKDWWLRYTWIESEDVNEYESICASKRWVSYKKFDTLDELFKFVKNFKGPLKGESIEESD